ncbi:BadF/BadG/BcrA/BcrD ATPase family protein [Telmatospirillum sp.]|uniref:N-acetylglucosamine kinase n=1 Tax=Telmatospirillum sp. TaxID=2079197 RepID=UPI00284AFD36|nr:BadF/BadG/BcrA/BcrD ATPase family protein [Telmatospirillum sp.]MDR3436211.1 BadF/BadG/BcrA/BcrD ATPase family protein [Telmatospirillum sp.]
MSRTILGIDGGGTKTLAALASVDGHISAVRRFATLDPAAEHAWQDELQAIAGFVSDQHATLEASVFGLPMFGEVEAYSERQTAAVTALFPGSPLVANDVRVAFDGAFACGPGALILSGTGSMAWASLGRTDSPHVRVGGWGDLFGDEGSAYWIGREALALVSHHLDGRAAVPEFAEGILAAIGVTSQRLLGWCYGQPNSRTAIAALARSVDALAGAGNADADALIDRAAQELALQLTAAWRACGGGDPMPWSYAGGTFRSKNLLVHLQQHIGSSPKTPRLPPIGGALLRAAQIAGWQTDETWIARLSDDLKDWQ